MRITLIADPELVNTNYRGYQPLHVLSQQGHELVVNRIGEPRFRTASVLNSDAVLIHRYFDPEVQQLIAHAQARGIGIVWDNDDDLTNVPRSNPQYKLHSGAARRRITSELTRTVRAADVVTAPSTRLCDQYRDAGASDVRLLENFLPPEFERIKPRKHSGVTLVYLAGLEHAVDYQQLRLGDTLQRLLDAHPDLRVLSIGLGLGLRTDRYEHQPLVDFLDLARVMSVADIGIAPLIDIPWNQARSNIKLKEYAAAGLPWLASPVGPYTKMGEAQGGILVPDDGWHDQLDALIRDTRRRRKLAKRATKWVKDQSITRRAHLWEQALRDAAIAARLRIS
jgi:glycosyltransferase involved in cell wall biosynthesis